MKECKLHKVAAKRLNTISKMADNIICRDEPEDIHELRKAYKKLRAFTRLVRAQEGSKNPLKPIKDLYHAAGHVRDRQIFRWSVERYYHEAKVTDEAYLEQLDAEIASYKKALYRQVKDFRFVTFREKVLNFLPGELTKESVAGYRQQKLTELKKALKREPEDETLHDIRKILKDLRYNSKQASHLPRLKDSEGDLKTFTDLLGDFNDTATSLTLLAGADIDPLPVEEKKLLIQLKYELMQIKATRKQTAIGQAGVFRQHTLSLLLMSK